MPEEIALTTIKHDTKESIACRLGYCPLPSFPQETCLVAEFTGTIDNTTGHEGGYSYMHAMIGTGFAACNPATLLLDLRGLKYDSGDDMCRILDQRLIAKVVISDLNRTGLTNLVSSKLFLDAKKELFESLEGALHACDEAYRKFLRDGRKKIMAADF